MKKILLAFIVLLVGTTLFGQNTPPPQAFKYQAVVRDNAGQPMGGIDVSFQITIKEVSCSGTIVYQEEHVSIPTNDYGLVNLDIGTSPDGGAYLFCSFTLKFNFFMINKYCKRTMFEKRFC